MSYGRYAYAGAAYGGSLGAAGAGGGVSIVDPANPTLPGYQWLTSPIQGAYGQTAYAGGGVPQLPAAAGLLPISDEGSANVRLAAWWADAGQVWVTRRYADGTREGVPGAQPLVLPVATRRNYATNPSFENNAAGYLNGSNTTSTYMTDGDALVGTDYLRLAATAAGSVTLTVPVAMPMSPVGISLNLRFPSGTAPTGALTASIAYTSDQGNSMGSVSATLANSALATFAGRWDRTPVLEINPPVPIVTGTSPNLVVNNPVNGVLTISIAGMTAGKTVDVDAVLVEAGTGTSGAYFDGDNLFGYWAGTSGNSVSALAAPVQFVDQLPPFDTPFRYEMTTGSQPGNRVVTDLVTVDSQDTTWLGHPTLGSFPIHVTTAPQLTTTIKRGIYEVYGRGKPITVTANVRQAPSGTLELYAEDFGVRDRIVDLLDDGSPLRVRMPGDYGYGGGWWISVGDVTETANGPAWGPRYLTLPFNVVDPPSTVG